MSTVVYISNQHIEVVLGNFNGKKISVAGCYMTDAPDGSIINGIVMDVELFVGHLRDFWQQYKLPTKDVTLVVSSSKFIGKKIEMPSNLSGRNVNKYIEREYSDVKKEDESLLYGYVPVDNDGKTKRIYAESIYQEFITDFIDIFDNLGVKLKAIYSGEGSLINLISFTMNHIYKNFVIQIAEQSMLTTLLYVNGSFYYFNSVRCFHEKDSYDYSIDVARSVSQIIQFMKANQIEVNLEAVVLAGVNRNMLSMYQSSLMQHEISCKIEMFETGNVYSPNCDIQSCIYGISGLVDTGKNQNYLKNYKANYKKNNMSSEKLGFIKAASLIGGVFLLMMIVLFACLVIRANKKKELKNLQKYNNDIDVIMDVEIYNVLQERNEFLLEQYESIIDIEENIDTYPMGNTKVRDIILKSAGGLAEVNFESFDANEGVLTMSAKAQNVDDINLFIKRLKELDIFSSVNYSGYTYIDNEEVWNINVDCILRESAGK